MPRPGQLVKRWRTGEYEHPSSRTKVGLYVNPDTGGWYARIPEHEDGELVTGGSRGELLEKVRAEAKRLLELEWRPVIRVHMAPPRQTQHHGLRARSSWDTQWDPADYLTAGDEVEFTYARSEVAVDSAGKALEREWQEHAEESPYDHRKAWPSAFKPRPGVDVELPYTPELWDALGRFLDRIRMLNHGLRTLMSQPDFGQRLLSMPAVPLLTMNPAESTATEPPRFKVTPGGATIFPLGDPPAHVLDEAYMGMSPDGPGELDTMQRHREAVLTRPRVPAGSYEPVMVTHWTDGTDLLFLDEPMLVAAARELLLATTTDPEECARILAGSFVQCD